MRITAKTIGHGLAVPALTLLRQLGGLAWLTALAFRKKRWWFWPTFVLAYGVLWVAAYLLAPSFGRTALPNWQLNAPRTRAALEWLARDPRAGKILVEPHIPATLGLSDPKIRFQGCRAAQHVDHIYLQL